MTNRSNQAWFDENFLKRDHVAKIKEEMRNAAIYHADNEYDPKENPVLNDLARAMIFIGMKRGWELAWYYNDEFSEATQRVFRAVSEPSKACPGDSQ